MWATAVLMAAPVVAAPLGGFWQVTDVHIDQLKECSGTEGKWYGSFDGLFGCGCSIETLNATAAFMEGTMSQPDFILFSGDATASGDIMSKYVTHD